MICITYCAVDPATCSLQTLIPFERVVSSIYLLLFIRKKEFVPQAQKVLTEWSGVLEWLWDFSKWKLTEVFRDWCFWELENLILWHDSVGFKWKILGLCQKKMVFFSRFWRDQIWITYPVSWVTVVLRFLLSLKYLAFTTIFYIKERNKMNSTNIMKWDLPFEQSPL